MSLHAHLPLLLLSDFLFCGHYSTKQIPSSVPHFPVSWRSLSILILLWPPSSISSGFYRTISLRWQQIIISLIWLILVFLKFLPGNITLYLNGNKISTESPKMELLSRNWEHEIRLEVKALYEWGTNHFMQTMQLCKLHVKTPAGPSTIGHFFSFQRFLNCSQ